jgi:hypothetical protein
MKWIAFYKSRQLSGGVFLRKPIQNKRRRLNLGDIRAYLLGF